MRKKILILGHNYATQFIDIYNQYTRVFDPDKFAVTVAFLTGESNPEVKERMMAEQVLFLNQPKKNIRTLKIKAIKQLYSLCKTEKFHIVICHRYKPAYIMLWVAQLCRIPALVFVMHELKTISSLGRQLLIACLARKNMLFAGVSDAVRNDMRKNLWNLPKERIATLYNMIDVDVTEPQLLTRNEAREALSLSAEDFVFGHIARLALNKDQESLIQAFSQIKTTCTRAKLVIAGDGELELKLKAQVKALNLTQEVIFTGFLPQAFRYMKAFDCFVLPSIQEAFGRVLLEAMIAKLTIIATKVHGIPEVVGNSGILINPKDVTALVASMKQIYMQSHAERAAQGVRAYAQVKNHFSIPQFREQFWQLPLIAGIRD